MPRRRRRHRRVRQRARPGPAVQPREAARPHRHRPHRGDPRHLRPERPHPGGQGPGRAGPAALPPAAAAPRRRTPSCRSRAAASAPGSAVRRDQARGRPPAHHAPHHQARGRARRARPHPHAAAQGPRPQRPRRRSTIVGYTNAGKSTLLNRLTDAGVLVEDRLFATLDPTTRRLALPGGEPVLLTDTVGFVRRLPHGLVEAFKSTLESGRTADLLVHVVDASAARSRRARSTPCATVLGRDRRRAACPSCWCSTRPTSRPTRPSALVDEHAGSVADQRRHRRGHRRVPAHARRPAAGARQRRRAARSRTTAATCWPRSTARARCVSTHRRATTACGCGPGSPTRRPAGLPSSSSRRPDATLAWPAVGRLDAMTHRRLRPAAVPLRPARPAGAAGRGARRRRRRPVDRHAVRSAAAGGGRRAGARPTAERGYPPSIGIDRAARRRPALDRPPLRRRRARSPRSAACIGTKEFVGTLPQWLQLRTPEPRHRALPGGRLPDLRDGRDPGRLPAGAGAAPAPAAARPRRRSTPTTPAGPCACGSTARATRPARSTTSARRRRGGGPTACPCSATSATSSSPGTARPARSCEHGTRRRGRRALAVEALEPGRRAGRLLRRRRRAGRATCRRCASTSG